MAWHFRASEVMGDLLNMKLENAKEESYIYNDQEITNLPSSIEVMGMSMMVPGPLLFSGYFVCGLERVVYRKETAGVADLNVGFRGIYTSLSPMQDTHLLKWLVCLPQHSSPQLLPT